jgi:hypothetical protein
MTFSGHSGLSFFARQVAKAQRKSSYPYRLPEGR